MRAIRQSTRPCGGGGKAPLSGDFGCLTALSDTPCLGNREERPCPSTGAAQRPGRDRNGPQTTPRRLQCQGHGGACHAGAGRPGRHDRRRPGRQVSGASGLSTQDKEQNVPPEAPRVGDPGPDRGGSLRPGPPAYRRTGGPRTEELEAGTRPEIPCQDPHGPTARAAAVAPPSGPTPSRSRNGPHAPSWRRRAPRNRPGRELRVPGQELWLTFGDRSENHGNRLERIPLLLRALCWNPEDDEGGGRIPLRDSLRTR